MKELRRTFTIVCLLTLLTSGCETLRFPGVHRINIQQGNVISQNMVNKLKPGMTRRQVQFVLGNPVINDQLARDRWDYVYSMKVGGSEAIKVKLQVYFVDNRLSHFNGNFKPTTDTQASPSSDTDTSTSPS